MGKRWLFCGFWITQDAAVQIDGAIMGGNRHKFMAEPLEMGGKLAELSRKILMNQQDPHQSNP